MALFPNTWQSVTLKRRMECGVPLVYLRGLRKFSWSLEIQEDKNVNENGTRLQIVNQYSYLVGSPWSIVATSSRP
jgi:hypothetical protein